MREITIDTVQGVGDLFWVVQKLSPHFDKINLNILCIDTGDLQTRAKKFIELLPKIGTINYKVTTSANYNRVAWTKHKMSPLLADFKIIHEYAVNKPMEEGTRIDEIDPGLEVAWDLPFNIPTTVYKSKPYIVLYISGSKNNMSWDKDKWLRLIIPMYQRYRLTHELVLFGADYDKPALVALVGDLRRRGIKVSGQIGGSAETALRCVRDASLFIGYQSGMNVIADNYNVPQIMLYFPYLKPMLNTWCKPGHAEKKIFNGFTFDQLPETILESCKIVLSAVAESKSLL